MNSELINRRFVALFVVGAICVSGFTGCAKLDEFLLGESATIETFETTETEPPYSEPLNDAITSSVELADKYHFELQAELMPLRGFFTEFVDGLAVDNDQQIYTVGGDIHYKNTSTNAGFDFRIINTDVSTSNITISGSDFYLSQTNNQYNYVSKCFVDEANQLGNCYWYKLSSFPGGEYHEYFGEDCYYVLTSGDADGNNQEILRYNFTLGHFDEELEPVASATVRNGEGLICLNNNLYVIKQNTNGYILLSVADLLSGNDTAEIPFEEISSMYSGTSSEYINFLGTLMYVDASSCSELNLRNPIGYTMAYSKYMYAVNKNGGVHMLAYNNIYKMVPGDSDMPEPEETFPKGNFYVIWHPSGIYETADGTYATFTEVEPIIYSDDEINNFCDTYAVSTSEEEIYGTLVRYIHCDGYELTAARSTTGLWTLFYDVDGYLFGIGGCNLWLETGEITLRLSDNCEYYVAVPSEIPEGSDPVAGYAITGGGDRINDADELSFYMNRDFDSTFIHVQNNEVVSVTFIYQE